MSSTTIPKNLFEKVELVTANSSDPDLDHNNLVYVDSDSDVSEKYNYEMELQEEIINLDYEGSNIAIGITEVPDMVKQEEECIIDDAPVEMNESEDFSEDLMLEVKSPESALLLSEIFKEEVEDLIPVVDVSFDVELTNQNPPPGMCNPSESFEYAIQDEEQFEIIHEPDESKKTDIDEVEGEKENVAIKKDTSYLVDHQYSQPETIKKGFCDDILQEMLKNTGINNQASVQLLSKFTEMFEHFVDDDANPQLTLYLRSMKNSLGDLKIAEKNSSEPPPPAPKLECVTNQSEYTEVPMTQDSELTQEKEEEKNDEDDCYLTATQDSVQDTKDESEVVPNEDDAAACENIVDTVKEEEISQNQVSEKQNVIQLKIELTNVSDFGQKLSGNAIELMNSNMETDETFAEAKKQLLILLTNSRKEYRLMISEIRKQNAKEQKDLNESSRKNLIKKVQDSSEFSSSSDSDCDQVVNLNRKIPKAGPQTSAIVSSTKEDSDLTDVDMEASNVESNSRASSLGSETGKSKNLGKEIEKLLDFSTLNCPKPASSKKVAKLKKLKKKKKKRGSDLDSLLSATSDDNSHQSSSSNSDGERETSDEEKLMQMRQNADIKNRLLAESNSSDDGATTIDDLSEFGISSDDDEPEQGSKEKEAEKDTEKPSAKSELKPKETEELKEQDDAESDHSMLSSVQKLLEKESKAKNPSLSNDDDIDGEHSAKKRTKLDPFEREIFSKGFLEINGSAAKKPSTSSTASSQNASKSQASLDEPTKDKPVLVSGKIDLSMFEGKKAGKEIDLIKLFERRANAGEAGGSSTNEQQQPNPSKPAPIVNEDECISLSSGSDSEISAHPTNANLPKRKKMLTEEELQEETKRAQKEETQRIERLKKKNEKLTQLMSQRSCQESDSGDEDLVLDYDPKKKKTIFVDRQLVKQLKPHQRDGIKFMYDTCFGSISDEVKTASGCILAHCMGLGKTLQLITLVHTLISHQKELQTKKIMVICPKSTIMNWFEEFNKWLGKVDGKNLKIYYLDLDSFENRVRVVKEWYEADRPGVFLINYDAFRNMVNYSGSKRAKIQTPEPQIKKLQDVITKCLLKPGPDLVVCDEGHLIKNQTGATNKAISKINTRRRIILTGTPVQNNLNEYFAMVDWIKPALLGTNKEFNNLYGNPIKDGQHMDSTPQMIKRMKQRSFILNKKLSNIVQRKEAMVLRDFLPDKYEYCIFVPLTTVQENLYERFLKQNPLDGGHKLLNDYTALRKIWTHPKVLQTAYERAMNGELKIAEQARKRSNHQVEDGENDEPDDNLDVFEGNTGVKSNWWKQFVTEHDLESIFSSNKLIILFEILRLAEMKGDKVLVFSGFVAVLNAVENFMKKINNCNENSQLEHNLGYTTFKTSWIEGVDYYRLDGSTKRDVRHQMIEKFNDRTNKRLRCFLISAKAGGMGINLIGANRCIILDTSWNPSADQQNIFRIYRLGQPKVCYVYRLIALGTMEEKVYSRSVTKQAMSGRVVDKQQIDRHYRMDELSELYVLTKVDYNKRPAPILPADDIMKHLLHKHPNRAFNYHDHDSLLENKPDQDLNEEEINEAWQNYEMELRPVARPGLSNGPIPLNANDLLRSDLLNMFGGGAAPLDSASGLFKQLYQQPTFFPNEYMSLLPYDVSYRSLVPTTSSNNATPSTSASSVNSSLLLNQLNNGMLGQSLRMFPWGEQTNITPSGQKRRTSNTKRPSLGNVDHLASLQQRYNGSLSRPNEDVVFGKNSSSHMSLLPDADIPIIQKGLPASKYVKSIGNQSNNTKRSVRAVDIYKQPTSAVRKLPPAPAPIVQQPIPQRSSLSTAQRTPVTPIPVTLPSPTQRSSSSSGIQRPSPANSTVFKPSQSPSLKGQSPYLKSQMSLPAKVPPSPKFSVKPPSQIPASSISPAGSQRSVTISPIPPQRSQSTIILPPPQRSQETVILPSTQRSVQSPSKPRILSKTTGTFSAQRTQPMSSQKTTTQAPGSSQMMAVKNVNFTNSATSKVKPSDLITQRARAEANAKTNAARALLAARQNAPAIPQRPQVAKASQNTIPQQAPRVAHDPKVKSIQQSQQKFVFSPARTQTINLGDTIKRNVIVGPNQNRSQIVPGLKGSPITVTKIPITPIQPGSPITDVRLASATPVISSIMTLNKSQPTTSKTISQSSSSSTTQYRLVAPQKRSAEPLLSQNLNAKRKRIETQPAVKLKTRDDRERMTINTSSIIEDIVEIE